MSSRSRSTSSAIPFTPSGDDGECLQSAARKPGLGALSGPDFAAQPKIAPNYLSTPGDRDVAVRSIRSPAASPPSRLCTLSPGGVSPRLSARKRCRLEKPPAISARRSSTPSAPAAWGGSGQRRRSTPAAARLEGPAHRRCLGDADDHLGQHQFPDPDDCRKGGRDDPRRSPLMPFISCGRRHSPRAASADRRSGRQARIPWQRSPRTGSSPKP